MSRAVAALLLLLAACPVWADGKPPRLGPPPKRLALDPWYAKHTAVGGLPVVASKRVSDRALHVTAAIVSNVLARRPDVLKALVRAKVRIAVIGKTEQTTDLPEYRNVLPRAYWNKRARGFGATTHRPVCSSAEENLLGLVGDRYQGESILIHELAHTVHLLALRRLDPTFEPELHRAYARAKKRGLWKRTYALKNAQEYWAEGVQAWFDAGRVTSPPNGIKNHVATRKVLAVYDPPLAKLIARVFKNTPWRWTPPATAKRKTTKTR